MTIDDGIQPGTFRDVPEDERIVSTGKDADIYVSDQLVALYTAFREQVHEPQSVLYPSCGYDASPAHAFTRVTFVDNEDGNRGCIQKLRDAGLNALRQDIRTYVPQEAHDLLILLNPQIPVGWATPHLVPGGYVIANEYHNSASELYAQPERFTMLGTIDSTVDQDTRATHAIVRRNVEDVVLPGHQTAFDTYAPKDQAWFQGVFASFAINMPHARADLYIFQKREQ